VLCLPKKFCLLAHIHTHGHRENRRSKPVFKKAAFFGLHHRRTKTAVPPSRSLALFVFFQTTPHHIYPLAFTRGRKKPRITTIKFIKSRRNSNVKLPIERGQEFKTLVLAWGPCNLPPPSLRIPHTQWSGGDI